MKAVGIAALTLALTATPALARDGLEGEFEKLKAIAVEFTGQPASFEFCNENMCSADIGLHRIELMWPENGWIWVNTYPAAGARMDENMFLCAAAIEYTTGLGVEGSGAMAGRLAGVASNDGSASTDIGGAKLKASMSGGTVECDARRETPLQ